MNTNNWVRVKKIEEKKETNVRHKNHKKRWETRRQRTQPQPYIEWKAIIYSLIHSSLNFSFNFQNLRSSITTTLSFSLPHFLSLFSSIAAAHCLIFFSSNGFGRSIRRQFLSPGTPIFTIYFCFITIHFCFNLEIDWLILCCCVVLCCVCAGEQ